MFPKNPSAAAVEETTVSQKEFSDVLPGLNETIKTITVSNDDFGFWVSEINNNPQDYVGYKIKLTGFVYIDPELCHEDEFMASRMLMTCCAADVTPLGLICKYDKTSQLKSSSWVTVEGTLFSAEQEYNGQPYDTPEISVTEIIPAKEVSGYVYAY
jgi:putative membrane protein